MFKINLKFIHRQFADILFAIRQNFREIGDFVVDLIEYFVYRTETFLFFIFGFIKKNFNILGLIKFKFIGTLIWSRGRRSLFIRYLFVFVSLWTVSLVGGVFQNKVVKSDNLTTQDFLTSESLFVFKASAATTQSEFQLPDKPIEHEVLQGETIFDIGKKYNISAESIKFANNLVSDQLKIGSKLIIPPVEGTVIQVTDSRTTVDSLAKKYKVPAQSIVDFNYLDYPYELQVGQYIAIPQASLPSQERYYTSTPTYGGSAYGIVTPEKFEGATGKFIWPFSGILTQLFGPYHPGIDIAKNTGDIVSIDKGKVIRAGWWQGGYGNAVQIDHGNGYISTYAHMSVISVSVGDEVDKGQKIGVVGSTGRSTGPHVHFTIQFEGKYIDPLTVLPK